MRLIKINLESILVSTKLMDLDISENPIGNTGIEIISELINENQIGHLKRLNVSNCKIDFEGFILMIYALENNKRLEVLNFSKNSINSKKFSIIKQNMLNINIKELILMKCRLGNNGSKILY
jgi:Ran GTPase-activating protein (RanGAP) involved in mRNA processing and transport